MAIPSASRKIKMGQGIALKSPSIIGLVLLTSCSSTPSNDDIVDSNPIAQISACPKTQPQDWQAWVNRMPGPDGPKLHITGSVTFSDPGLSASLILGPLDRRRPPVQRILMKTNKSVEDTADKRLVSANFPAFAASYKSIIIVCGDQNLVTISDIEVAH